MNKNKVVFWVPGRDSDVFGYEFYIKIPKSPTLIRKLGSRMRISILASLDSGFFEKKSSEKYKISKNFLIFLVFFG